MLLRDSLQTVGVGLDLAPNTEFPIADAASRLRRLVILGSSDTALALVRDAHRHGLEPVVFDMTRGPAMYSRHARAQPAARATRDGDRASLLRELRELGDPRHTALIATSDDWLRRVMAVRAQLSDSYRTLLMPADDTLEICLDKTRFALWCREQDIAHAASWRVGLEDRPARLAPPFVIRPALSRPPMHADPLPKAAFAADEVELAEWLARFKAADCLALVCESLLERPLIQYSVGFARRPGRFLGFVAEKVRPGPGQCDEGTFVSLRDEPGVLALGRQVAEALDFHGIGEIGILHDRSTGRHVVVEVNARPWRQYALAAASGHDLLHVLTQVRASDLPRGCSTGIHWWSPLPDLLTLARHRPSGPLGGIRTLARMGRALARANVYARLDWTDPWPALPRRYGA